MLLLGTQATPNLVRGAVQDVGAQHVFGTGDNRGCGMQNAMLKDECAPGFGRDGGAKFGKVGGAAGKVVVEIEHQGEPTADAVTNINDGVPVCGVMLTRLITIQAQARIATDQGFSFPCAWHVIPEQRNERVGLRRVVPHEARIVADREIDANTIVGNDGSLFKLLSICTLQCLDVGGAAVSRQRIVYDPPQRSLQVKMVNEHEPL